MKFTFIITFVAVSFTFGQGAAFAHIHDGHELDYESCSAFPENDLRYPEGLKFSSTIDEHQFNQYISQFREILAPKIRRTYEKKLIIEGQWEEDRVNASATRDEKFNPLIRISGGLARHPDMNRDAFFLILCHELGHQFGGAPKKFRGRTDIRSWSSSEGQADYYAATRCMPYLLEHLGEEATLPSRGNKGPKLAEVCQSETCQRIVLAAQSVAEVFYDVRPQGHPPDILSTDPSEVWMTEHGHPIPQCRLDTLISAANCEIKLELDRPFDDQNPEIGACLPSAKSGQRKGERPRCWFNPENF